MPRERKEETCTWKNSRTTARVEEKGGIDGREPPVVMVVEGVSEAYA